MERGEKQGKKKKKEAKRWKERKGKQRSVSDLRKEDQLLLGNHDREDK